MKVTVGSIGGAALDNASLVVGASDLQNMLVTQHVHEPGAGTITYYLAIHGADAAEFSVTNRRISVLETTR